MVRSALPSSRTVICPILEPVDGSKIAVADAKVFVSGRELDAVAGRKLTLHSPERRLRL